ncbi:MAG: hypothetical protein EOP06_17830 [Proteobacteria bacterium]|nr:MAG: hypothetical protein EOP06_17830 [Pseudomonadota bacterium]
MLEEMYENQPALGAALMELTVQSDKQGSGELGINVSGALVVIGENAGHIKQILIELRTRDF